MEELLVARVELVAGPVLEEPGEVKEVVGVEELLVSEEEVVGIVRLGVVEEESVARLVLEKLDENEEAVAILGLVVVKVAVLANLVTVM
jgi:hypothetical protein